MTKSRPFQPTLELKIELFDHFASKNDITKYKAIKDIISKYGFDDKVGSAMYKWFKKEDQIRQTYNQFPKGKKRKRVYGAGKDTSLNADQEDRIYELFQNIVKITKESTEMI